jgi:serine/threonine protein phosphatase PrpC
MFIEALLYLFKWANIVIVLVFIWERKELILRLMGQQQSEPVHERRNMDSELHEQNAQHIAELENRVANLHNEAHSREAVLKRREDDINELKETIRLHERKQEQLKHAIATYERISFSQNDQVKTRADKDIHETHLKLSEKEREIQELKDERDRIKSQLQAYIERSKHDGDAKEAESSRLINTLENEIAALREQLACKRDGLEETQQVSMPPHDSAKQPSTEIQSQNSQIYRELAAHSKETKTDDKFISNENALGNSLGFDTADLSSLASGLHGFDNEMELLSSFESVPPSSLGIFSKSSTVEDLATLEPLSPTKIQSTRNNSKLLTDKDKTTRIKLGDICAPSTIDGTNHKQEGSISDQGNMFCDSNLSIPELGEGHLNTRKGKSTPRESLFSIFSAHNHETDTASPSSVLQPALQTGSEAGIVSHVSGAVVVGYSSKADVNKAGLKRAKKKPFPSFGGKGSTQPQMEDFHFCCYPFDGKSSSALFGVFDGHAGIEAASEAAVLVPKEFSKQLALESDLIRGAGEVLRKTIDAVDKTLLHCEYVGTTATLVYVWEVGNDRYIQAANLGDSAAFLCRGSSAVKLTMDHKASEPHEKQRMRDAGIEIGDNQSRINGLAVSRSLGNHFVKEQKIGMIADPYIHDCTKIEPSDLFVVIASDGLWDIVSGQRAVDIVLSAGPSCSSEDAASLLLRTAVQSSKCNDNVTVVVVQLNKCN